MKKILLTTCALLSAMAALCVPTATELANMTLKMNRLGYYNTGGSIVSITPTDTEGEYTVTNFSGDAYYMPLPAVMRIDADGNITIAPQVLGNSGSLYWIIPDAAKGKLPAQFTDTDVITGKLANGKITINAYNVLITSADSTQRQGVRHNQALTSVIVAPNATITRGRWEPNYDDNYDRFLGWVKSGLEEPAHVAYAEVSNGQLTVMNFDKLYACGVFDLISYNNTFAIDPEQVVYRYWGSSNGDYVLAKIPEQLRTEEDAATGETVIGTISDDGRTFTLTDIAVLKATTQYIDYINGRPIYQLIITLDNDEPATPGDANGDGNVDIDDVNQVINMLLEQIEKTPSADVTGDGLVDIADVNAIINIILAQ